MALAGSAGLSSSGPCPREPQGPKERTGAVAGFGGPAPQAWPPQAQHLPQVVPSVPAASSEAHEAKMQSHGVSRGPCGVQLEQIEE